MRTNDFISMCLGNNKTGHRVEFTGYWYKSENCFVSWRKRSFLADLTQYLDFGCNFKNGRCAGKHEKGCCDSCQYTIGYFNTLPNNIKTIKEIAKYFNIETGFWRENKGCILPRKFRSSTCLSAMCDSDKIKKNNPLKYKESLSSNLLKIFRCYLRDEKFFVNDSILQTFINTDIHELGVMIMKENNISKTHK